MGNYYSKKYNNDILSSNIINDIVINKINNNKDDLKWLLSYLIFEWYNINMNHELLLNKIEHLSLIIKYLDNNTNSILNQLYGEIIKLNVPKYKHLEFEKNLLILSVNIYLNNNYYQNKYNDKLILDLLDTLIKITNCKLKK
jgi:hypothetical protein